MVMVLDSDMVTCTPSLPGTRYVVEVDLEIVIILLPPLGCWFHMVMLRIEPRDLCMLGKYYQLSYEPNSVTNDIIFPCLLLILIHFFILSSLYILHTKFLTAL